MLHLGVSVVGIFASRRKPFALSVLEDFLLDSALSHTSL